MNEVWFKIWGVFEDSSEIPLEVWEKWKDAASFARTENKILKRKVLKVKPIAVDIARSKELLNK